MFKTFSFQYSHRSRTKLSSLPHEYAGDEGSIELQNREAQVRNRTSFELSFMSLRHFRVNLNEPTFDFIIHLPRIEFKGKYDLKIRVVLLDLAGKGDIYGVLGNIL